MFVFFFRGLEFLFQYDEEGSSLNCINVHKPERGNYSDVHSDEKHKLAGFLQIAKEKK